MKMSLVKGASLVPVLVGCALASLVATAQAQLSSAQQSALKSNCRSDFMSHCSGVAPGGKDALACLQKNVASLSRACQQVVQSTLPPPQPAQASPPATKPAAAPPPRQPAAVAAPPQQAAPAPAAPAPKQPTAAQQDAMRANCRNDFMTHCPGVAPGGKDALACLQKNVNSLSATCKKVVGATLSAPPASSPGAAPPPAKTTKAAPPPKPAPAPTAAAPTAPTAAQQNAMKANCRNDFMTHCAGVSPGGKEAFGCLQQNVAKLSAACKNVVSATLSEPPPAGAAGAPVAIAPPPAASESGPFVPGAALILKACARDLLMNCRGIAGDGKAVACLKTHAQNGGRLGIRCRAALNITSKLR